MIIKILINQIKMILLLLAANFILSSSDYMIDVILLYTMNLEIYIWDINKVDIRIAFTHKKGVSNYDLSKE